MVADSSDLLLARRQSVRAPWGVKAARQSVVSQVLAEPAERGGIDNGKPEQLVGVMSILRGSTPRM